MKKLFFLLTVLTAGILTLPAASKDITNIQNYNWETLHLYKGVDQRGGPFKFRDTYLEFEFGGRYEWLDYYGYIDFLDILNDSNSDKHGKDNYFVDIEPRISIDYLTQTDLSWGILQELYFAFDIYYNDTAPGSDKGLKVIWMGLGSDLDLPWLGKSGVNFYTRFVEENFGASNEHSFDGYVAHINWFKPLYFFKQAQFLSFQGYVDYEFGSDMPESGNDFEQTYRTSDSFQAYLGLWLHDKKWALGYGLKAYKNMTQWKDGEIFFGQKTDTTGFGHYFNVAYKF